MSALQKRIELEKKIIRKTVTTLLDNGYMLSVYDGEDWAIKRSKDKSAIIAAMFSTDDDQLIVRDSEGNKIGWIHFVYGNDGWDVISDYTVNLEAVLKPVNEYAEKFS